MIQTPRDFFTAIFVGAVALTTFVAGIAVTTLIGIAAASLCEQVIGASVSDYARVWIDRVVLIICFIVGFYFSVILAVRAHKRLNRELEA